MDLSAFYQQQLHLQNAAFYRIDHHDAMVAVVYKIIQSHHLHFVLKICAREGDYDREVFFLNHFKDSLPVPHIIGLVPPQKNIPGAILMDCLPGSLLTITDLIDPMARQLGVLMARIHLNKASGYGDLTRPQALVSDPRVHFTLKFEEYLTVSQKCMHT